MVHRRRAVVCVFLTLLVALIVAGPVASRRARPPSPVSRSRDSRIHDVEALLAASPAVITERIQLAKVSPVRHTSGPATVALRLLAWFAGVFAGWLILQRVSMTRRGRAPPAVAA